MKQITVAKAEIKFARSTARTIVYIGLERSEIQRNLIFCAVNSTPKSVDDSAKDLQALAIALIKQEEEKMRSVLIKCQIKVASFVVNKNTKLTYLPSLEELKWEEGVALRIVYFYYKHCSIKGAKCNGFDLPQPGEGFSKEFEGVVKTVADYLKTRSSNIRKTY